MYFKLASKNKQFFVLAIIDFHGVAFDQVSLASSTFSLSFTCRYFCNKRTYIAMYSHKDGYGYR